MAELTKFSDKQAEQIITLKAENEKLSKQRRRMLGCGVLEELEESTLQAKGIQAALDQQLKQTQHDLRVSVGKTLSLCTYSD